MATYAKIATSLVVTPDYTTSDDTTYGNDVKLFQKAYTDNVANDTMTTVAAEVFGDVDQYVKDLASHLKLIKALNKGFKDWFEGLGDDAFESTQFAEDIAAEKAKIFKGEVTTDAELKAFVDAFGTSYDSKVAKYLSDAKESLLEIYNNKIAGVDSLAKVNGYKARYNDGLGDRKSTRLNSSH